MVGQIPKHPSSSSAFCVLQVQRTKELYRTTHPSLSLLYLLQVFEAVFGQKLCSHLLEVVTWNILIFEILSSRIVTQTFSSGLASLGEKLLKLSLADLGSPCNAIIPTHFEPATTLSVPLLFCCMSQSGSQLKVHNNACMSTYKESMPMLGARLGVSPRNILSLRATLSLDSLHCGFNTL